MRMKHGSDRGPTISVKPRLLAAFTAVAMMFATAVPALLPRTAVAVDTYTDVGGTCKPSTGSIGDISANGTEDRGVATWVGRDMYIGDKPGADQDAEVWLNGDMNGGTKPAGSYAVEAEGLTLVKGKLAINQVKNSWRYDVNKSPRYPGFRFGAVGFGGNFRPASGNTTLAVAGMNTKIREMKTDNVNNSSSTTVGAWTHGGWTGGSIVWNNGIGSASDPKYTASIKGNQTYWVSNSQYSSIANNQAGGDNFSSVPGPSESSWWNKENPFTLTYKSNVSNQETTTDYLKYKDNEDFGATIAAQSRQLSGLNQNKNADVSTGTATGEITRLRYNHDGGTTKIGVKIDNDKNNEKVVKFTGDNDPTHTMQVFNIDASILSSAGYSGTSFEFDKIPVISTYTVNGQTHNVYASVVVNVDGTNVDFHNGWNFKWNGEDIGDGYVNGSDNAPKYNDAASSIMWNFYNADRVAIRGGMIKADSGKWASSDESISVRSSQPGYENYITSDDPAAAMLGSIMVPKGTFDDHVTTNGRVWVGKDFMMNSPYVLKNGNDSWIPGDVTDNEKTPTASIIAMDMERHNFGWSASINTACSVIAWNKVNQSGDSLGGTSWGIYKTAEAAAKRATKFEDGLIRYVTDDDMSADQDSTTPGRIEVNNLTPKANYYIRELDTHNTQYELNPYIYKIEAGESENENPDGNPYADIAAVYKVTNATTGEVEKIDGTDEAKQLLDGKKIVNKSSGFAIEWGKTERGKTEGLEGSEWILSQDTKQWVVRDDGTPIESITIQKDGSEVSALTGSQGSTITGLKAVIDPADANQRVTWSVAPEGSADVIQETNGTTSVVLRTRPASGQITVTATAADGQYASVVITVTESIVVAPSTASIEVGATQRFSATYQGGALSSNPTWSVQDRTVATIDSDGNVTGVGAGTTDVYADWNGMRGIATITVTAPTSTTIYALVPNGWNNPTLYMWYGPKGSEVKLNGDWPGHGMTYVKDQNGQKLYSATVSTTHAFHFIISNNGSDQTADSKEVAAGGGTYDVTNVKKGEEPIATKRTSNNNGSNGDGSGRSNVAPRRMKAAKEAAWTPVNTTDWTVANDKAKNDDNPAPGKFKVSGLKPGTYYLQENKAPDGYFVNPAKFKIVIAENGTVTWTKSVDGGKTWTAFDPTNGLHWIEDVPTEFSWTKVDAGYDPENPNTNGNPIAGSKWKLQKFQNGNYVDEGSEITDCVADAASGCTGTDKDHRAGKFKLTGLTLGKYRLYESEAPEGYQTPTNVYYYFELSTKTPGDTTPVKWTKGTSTSFNTTDGSYNGNRVRSVQETKAPNYRQTGSVSWTKVDAEDTTKVLGGSEWTIKFKAEGTSQYGAEYKIVDCTSGDCAVPSGTTQPGWTYDRDPAVGKFKLENLQWGDYEFYESKAPDGYNLSTETYTFTVPKSNVNTTIAITGTDVSDNKIPNEPGFELPSTGGEGNTLIVLSGVALTAISMLGCAIALRKRI